MRARPANARLFWAAVALAGIGLLAPLLASLGITASAAFGHLPALGARGPNLAAWAALLGTPGLGHAVQLTLVTGGAAAVVSLALAICLAATFGHSPRLGRWLSPFLAIPHAALAVGLAFLLAPSGWIARLLAPIMGWAAPPDVAIVGDAWGLALIAGLVIKETPFLLLIILAALRQIPLRPHMAAAQSLGYGRGAVWAKIIAPQLWPLIRLPFCVVLVYGLSVVDMAMILGPSHPPTLPVLVARLYIGPNLNSLLPASAGALAVLGLVAGALAVVFGAQRALAAGGRHWLRAGGRDALLDIPLAGAAWAGMGLLALGGMAMLVLGLWSLAWRWAWPQILPQEISLRAWAEGTASWGVPLKNTLVIAGASTAAAVILALAWLEGADRAKPRQLARIEPLIYLPLLLPQIAVMLGMNILALRLGMGGTLLAVIWGHCLFVFPYVMMALTGPWRALDPRYLRTAQSLGAGPWRGMVAVKLPLLLAPICAAAAIGLAVSVAQYLPTLFLGAGRLPTLTTEAVTLASSSNRRVTAVVSTLQAALPLLAYMAAVILPAYLHRHRRDLAQGISR